MFSRIINKIKTWLFGIKPGHEKTVKVLAEVEFNQMPGMRNAGLYNDRKLQIRQTDQKVMFYEVGENGKEYFLPRKTIKWLLHIRSLPRNKVIIQYL